jgi:hypothetical protein
MRPTATALRVSFGVGFGYGDFGFAPAFLGTSAEDNRERKSDGGV